jgi:hypothetical protein
VSVENACVISASPDSNGCGVSLTAAHTRGAAAAHVTVTYGGLSATVVFRVWYPVALRLQSTLATIQRVSAVPSKAPSSGRLLISGATGCTTIAGLDVSSVVAFASSNPTVANVSGPVVTAHQAGLNQPSPPASGP